jgi:hypothetical protein
MDQGSIHNSNESRSNIKKRPTEVKENTPNKRLNLSEKRDEETKDIPLEVHIEPIDHEDEEDALSDRENEEMTDQQMFESYGFQISNDSVRCGQCKTNNWIFYVSAEGQEDFNPNDPSREPELYCYTCCPTPFDLLGRVPFHSFISNRVNSKCDVFKTEGAHVWSEDYCNRIKQAYLCTCGASVIAFNCPSKASESLKEKYTVLDKKLKEEREQMRKLDKEERRDKRKALKENNQPLSDSGDHNSSDSCISSSSDDDDDDSYGDGRGIGSQSE